ncbi:hypothetical protein [Mucilaginibacter auburnensis]|uniref:PH domain-containing protein n=1 Tax=Mucilaginibacter auburnensis TaxID=1457233 RepID=A0A2H9VUD7_9SPHI|nr:hypothetical protein [Mucilaginibacter auburnensis]PJJ84418.1 hypothetical protein CLV57_1429 [Mucilaginibacter auburnensis]
MTALISKIQHDTFEKGEFIDEKFRDLSETLEIIKAFPWDLERTLTDVKLTGPSVTIQNQQGDFLKAAIFFNNKFCIYYLHNNAVYEYPVSDLQSVYTEVENFFNNVLDLEKYHRNLFQIDARGHFETDSFEYWVKIWRVLKLNIFTLTFSGLFLIANIAIIRDLVQFPPVILLSLLSCFIYILTGRIFYAAYINRNNYLKISKGNNTFLFGYHSSDIRSYNKTEVTKIVTYEAKGNRNPVLVEIYEIYFKDGTVIKISNMLISWFDLFDKFSDKMENLDVPIISGKRSLYKML